jgi:hypothetical protein
MHNENESAESIEVAMHALIALQVVIGDLARCPNTGMNLSLGHTEDLAFACIPADDDGRRTFNGLAKSGIDFGIIRCIVRPSLDSDDEEPHFFALLKRDEQWVIIDGANGSKVGLLHRNRAEDVLFSEDGRDAIGRHIQLAFPGGCRFEESQAIPFLFMPKRTRKGVDAHSSYEGQLFSDSLSQCYLPTTKNRSIRKKDSAFAAVNLFEYQDLLDGKNGKWLNEILLPE